MHFIDAASNWTRTACLSAALSVLAACSGGHSAAPPAAPTVTLTAAPTSVASGATTTLTWSTTNATACTASGGWSGTEPTSGTVTSAALTTTPVDFTLTCTGPGGSGTKTAAVTVTPPAPVVSLAASPTTVASGATTTLTWSTTNATACTASGGWSGTEPTSGTVTSAALTSTPVDFTLTCTGPGGSGTKTAAVTVTPPPVPPAPAVSLAASPTTVASGATTTLTWSTTNATACTASGGWSGTEATSGTVTSAALTTTPVDFTLTCTGPGGSGTKTAAVTVTQPPPTVSLAASPTFAVSGGTATLTWTSTQATACTASGGWSGTQAVSGSATTAPVTATTSYTLTCTGAGGSTAATASVALTNPASFTVTPRHAALTLSQAQQFSAAVPGGGTATWSVDGIVGGNATVGTITSAGAYTPPATPGTHTVLATSVADQTQSGSAAVAVTDLAGVFSFHDDLARTGQNLQEYALTPASVAGGSFGKRFSCAVDGEVFAQPLYVANLAIGGGTHNVVIVATQHDSVYAFDADSSSCTTYWTLKLLTAAGVTPSVDTINYTEIGGCNDMTEWGITGTPVIDPTTLTLYFVAATQESGTYYYRLHAVSVTTGAERAGSPVVISASVPGAGAGGTTVTFSALHANQRAGLALYGGGLFIGWSSHCDITPYWGWLMRYDATTLAQTTAVAITPNGTQGAIWMSGGAPAVDSSGSLFLSTGNGTFDPAAALPPAAPKNDFSMSFLNFTPGTLTLQDFYTPSSYASWSNEDLDISSSGVVVLPDGIGPTGHPNLLTGADKQGHIWLIDRTVGQMSEYHPGADETVQYLTLPEAGCTDGGCLYGTPAYYNQTVYVAPAGCPLTALPLTAGLYGVANAQNVAVASSLSAESYGYPGATPAVSASPSGNGLVWVLDNSQFGNQGNTGTSPAGTAILRAYAASDVTHALYSSATLPADQAGNAVKFTVPVVANGHVYVGGDAPPAGNAPGGQLTVYGLAP